MLRIGSEDQKNPVLNHEDRPDSPVSSRQKWGIDTLTLVEDDGYGDKTGDNNEDVKARLNTTMTATDHFHQPFEFSFGYVPPTVN